MSKKSVPMLGVIETLLGLASDYQGCCADGAQLPALEVVWDNDNMMELHSNTNVIMKGGEYIMENVPEYKWDEPQDGTNLMPSDRKRLQAIKQLVDLMLQSGVPA